MLPTLYNAGLVSGMNNANQVVGAGLCTSTTAPAPGHRRIRLARRHLVPQQPVAKTSAISVYSCEAVAINNHGWVAG
jgi:hypothetical protein